MAISKIDRRTFLTLAAATGAFALAPRIAFAAGAQTDRRFIFIIQRGAADGLEALVPIGDPDYIRARPTIVQDPANLTKLDAMFALHPALTETAKMYQAGEVLFAHAIATPYRDRSHFDGQNVMESGGAAPYAVRDGWMNRLAGLLPKTRTPPTSFTESVPMALRGANRVTSYTPSKLPMARDDLMSRVELLYQYDPQLQSLWAAALEARGIASANDISDKSAATIGKLAATFLKKLDGPRIAMIETNGWDTHNLQARRSIQLLSGLDAMLASLRDNLGPVWSQTVVLIATEFGRTVAGNGTGGTDHGTASLAMIAGGGVNGGRVLSDWPGLKSGALYENRDLKPTGSLDALIAGLSAEAFALEPARVAATLFPDGLKNKPLEGLIRT
jgi:uncharacterized protein (DUF1501 family)